MSQVFKPRLLPLLGWMLFLVAVLVCAYVYYTQPMVFMGREKAQESAASGSPDATDQALKNLATIAASNWLQMQARAMPLPNNDVIAPAPDEVAAEAAKASANLDPNLKGAVVVRSGKQLYLVLGLKRFGVGDRIETGESIRSLSMQAVRLRSPEGHQRTVEIGRGIGVQEPPASQW